MRFVQGRRIPVKVVVLTTLALAACGRDDPPAERPAASEPAPLPQPTADAAGVEIVSEAPKRSLHLAASAEEAGAIVRIPKGCERVDGHTLASSASDVRLHLNVSPCPGSPARCPDSLVDYLDSPELQAARQGAEVLTLRDAGDDRAVLVYRQPVLDVASVVMTDADRRVLVACSAQITRDTDESVRFASLERCGAMSVSAVRAAGERDVTGPSAALLCR